MLPISPAIYAPTTSVARLTIVQRLIATIGSLAALIVLYLAYQLTPDPSGTGTHTGLGLPRCSFMYYSGLPCPSCGMTTSFSYFAHGNLAASLWVQPMASLLALMTAMFFWSSAYAAVTGDDLSRLARRWPFQWLIPAMVVFAIAAWGWKIFIHLHGMDGWR